MHVGHLLYLEKARALGDVLIVGLNSDASVRSFKGPSRPIVEEKQRAKLLSALSCVDYVVIVPFTGAVEAIECVRPHIYCKGKEYEDPDFDTEGNLPNEMRAVKRVGGMMRLIGSIKYTSTWLLNLYFDHLSGPVRDFCAALAARYTRRHFVESVESFTGLEGPRHR